MAQSAKRQCQAEGCGLKPRLAKGHQGSRDAGLQVNLAPPFWKPPGMHSERLRSPDGQGFGGQKATYDLDVGLLLRWS